MDLSGARRAMAEALAWAISTAHGPKADPEKSFRQAHEGVDAMLPVVAKLLADAWVDGWMHGGDGGDAQSPVRWQVQRFSREALTMDSPQGRWITLSTPMMRVEAEAALLSYRERDANRGLDYHYRLRPVDTEVSVQAMLQTDGCQCQAAGDVLFCPVHSPQ